LVLASVTKEGALYMFRQIRLSVIRTICAQTLDFITNPNNLTPHHLLSRRGEVVVQSVTQY